MHKCGDVGLMKTEVVLKLDTSKIFIAGFQFNENRSCIEIYENGVIRIDYISFNENRSCIEILKEAFEAGTIASLMKTEVVLKSMSALWKKNRIWFNENRSCIEIRFIFF